MCIINIEHVTYINSLYERKRKNKCADTANLNRIFKLASNALLSKDSNVTS